MSTCLKHDCVCVHTISEMPYNDIIRGEQTAGKLKPLTTFLNAPINKCTFYVLIIMNNSFYFHFVSGAGVSCALGRVKLVFCVS